MKTALVIGATGLVGKRLVEQLLNDQRFGQVVVFVRRPSGFSSPRLTEHIIDFDKPEKWQHLVKGDVLFSTLGTTRKKAGSKEAQYKIDHDYQFQFAAAAARHGVPNYVLVSSLGASDYSFFFYSRMKGELERDVKELDFRTIVILQPAQLDGERQENRTAEKIGLKVMRGMNRMGFFKKLRPIMDYQVAGAMIHAALLDQSGVFTFKGNQLFPLAEGKVQQG